MHQTNTARSFMVFTKTYSGTYLGIDPQQLVPPSSLPDLLDQSCLLPISKCISIRKAPSVLPVDPLLFVAVTT